MEQLFGIIINPVLRLEVSLTDETDGLSGTAASAKEKPTAFRARPLGR